MNDVVDRGLLEQVKAIVRRDLRLGPDVAIPDDMPLIGGPIDLDSIDILLVISSIEKQFQIKVPNEVVGRAAFAHVTALSRYVQLNLKTLHVAPAAASAPAAVDWLARLPHGPEFRFVSSVREVEPGRHAVGYWTVRGDEAFLAGHFPGRPLVPGVLIGEALAQLAGIAAAGDGPGGLGGVLAQLDLRFLAPVAPPANVELQAVVSATHGSLRQCEVVASVGGRAVAKGNVSIHFEG